MENVQHEFVRMENVQHEFVRMENVQHEDDVACNVLGPNGVRAFGVYVSVCVRV